MVWRYAQNCHELIVSYSHTMNAAKVVRHSCCSLGQVLNQGVKPAYTASGALQVAILVKHRMHCKVQVRGVSLVKIFRQSGFIMYFLLRFFVANSSAYIKNSACDVKQKWKSSSSSICVVVTGYLIISLHFYSVMSIRDVVLVVAVLVSVALPMVCTPQASACAISEVVR